MLGIKNIHTYNKNMNISYSREQECGYIDTTHQLTHDNIEQVFNFYTWITRAHDTNNTILHILHATVVTSDMPLIEITAADILPNIFNFTGKV